ncbi:MAG: N-acetylneuraminate synthase family protein [Anaerolineales bacterium]|nr:N-acetylneuraminate synthase family protein [Anaerolineales bacterium]MCW5855383.1 N-acetylneuraminate synthase family protein [Anaerolineales bacterium]
MEITIQGRKIGLQHPTYFIADIAANHDGSLQRAVELIRLAKEAGADAAKFQNFQAPKIVSDYGFRSLDGQIGHQAAWTKSVVEVYAEASIPFEWTPTLKEACEEFDIHYFSSPYDYDAIEMLDPYVPAYKAGSSLISWPQAILRMAEFGKPVMIATGDSDMADVERTMEMLLAVNRQVVLMQCNTNYTAAEGNYDHLHLNVLKTYAERWPNVILGLSDHTQSAAPVVGAVALGARVIERHFTDSNERDGPDHKFALNPQNWAHMVAEVRILERALGSAEKFVAENEKETYIVQRHCLRAARQIKAGEVFSEDMLEVLRPATPGALMAWDIPQVLGRKAAADLPYGKDIRPEDLA